MSDLQVVLQETLDEYARVLAEKQVVLQPYETAREELNERFASELSKGKALQEQLSSLEAQVKALAVAVHSQTRSAFPSRGVQIKMFRTAQYGLAAAEEWARAHCPSLFVFDAKKYEQLLIQAHERQIVPRPDLEGIPGEVILEPHAQWVNKELGEMMWEKVREIQPLGS